MSGSPKEKLRTEAASEETVEQREVYLRDGRKLVVRVADLQHDGGAAD